MGMEKPTSTERRKYVDFIEDQQMLAEADREFVRHSHDLVTLKDRNVGVSATIMLDKASRVATTFALGLLLMTPLLFFTTLQRFGLKEDGIVLLSSLLFAISLSAFTSVSGHGIFVATTG